MVGPVPPPRIPLPKGWSGNLRPSRSGGEMARRWEGGIFGLMEQWGLEPEDLTTSDSR
jgi:hypothetical protein